MTDRLQVFDILKATPHWQTSFSEGVRDLDALLSMVGLTREDVSLPNIREAEYFPLRVPLSYVEKIEPGNPDDPLLVQVLPTAQEFAAQPGYSTDPLQETDMNPIPGLIHKYKNRVLLVTTQACAIHCRYCFRRHFPYSENSTSSQNMSEALKYVRSHPELDEVILSGGDPLSMTDDKLDVLLKSLADIDHIRRIRIHSRLLAILPSRVTEQFLALIEALSVPLVIVLHINHPHEIDDDLAFASQKIRKSGVHLLNQSVLLRGVNSSVDTLKALSLRLFDAGILPYYLHLLDPVKGAKHFDVPLEEAQVIMSGLQVELSGYLLPKLATEKPGLKSKALINFETL